MWMHFKNKTRDFKEDLGLPAGFLGYCPEKYKFILCWVISLWKCLEDTTLTYPEKNLLTAHTVLSL